MAYLKPKRPMSLGNDYIYPITLAEQVITDVNSNQRLGDALKNIPLTVYPVGSIYLSVNDTDPSILFGGTWAKIAAGRVLMGADDTHAVNSTAEAGLPNITGGFYTEYANPNETGSGALLHEATKSNRATGTNGTYGWAYVSLDASRSSSIYGNSETVQPPALFVNIWQRTA